MKEHTKRNLNPTKMQKYKNCSCVCVSMCTTVVAQLNEVTSKFVLTLMVQ